MSDPAPRLDLSPSLPRRAAQRGETGGLADSLFLAFDLACRQTEVEIAARLLALAELLLTRRGMPSGDEREMAALVAAHERLWHLRHRGARQP